MGEVHLAEHLLLKHPVAIKLIRPDRAGDPEALSRFEREVRATARLTHWNTVTIYDFGFSDDGTFYYAMEYLPGLTLEQVVQRHGPLSPGRVIHIMRQVCAALREAHGLHLVHRDIKPANIMLCERGGVFDVAKLLDFGLVRGGGPHAETLVDAHLVVGTPGYMSPEQAQGQEHLTPAADLYAVGATAYLLLTGEPAVAPGPAVQMIVAQAGGQVRPVRLVRPDAPADLEAVNHAMSGARSERSLRDRRRARRRTGRVRRCRTVGRRRCRSVVAAIRTRARRRDGRGGRPPVIVRRHRHADATG